jgi:hypothetical protein
MSSDLSGRAVKLFHGVLKYMGIDGTSSPSTVKPSEQMEILLKIYKRSLKRAELRDELLIQISKQTRNNPDR